MNLGSEPKKVAALSALVVIGGYIFYTNVLAGPEGDTRKTLSLGALPVSSATKSTAAPPNVKRAKVSVPGAFRPKLVPPAGERPNYANVDPTLRLDLLAKVQSVESEGGSRSLFQFSAAPPPTEAAKSTTEVAAIRPGERMYGPEPPPKPAPPPAPPPPPAITLKFYGYSAPKADGQKRAFFLDGEDIFVAAEGELVKKRYRVVQIGVNSVIMEDTEYKNNRQTLVLQQEQAT